MRVWDTRADVVERADAPAEALLADRVRLLFHLSSPATHAAIVVLTAAVLWPVVPRAAVVAWTAVMLAITAARAAMKARFRRHEPPATEMRRWIRRDFLLIAATGVCWGAGALFFFGDDSFAYRVFFALALGGTALGAVGTASPSMPVVLGALVPSVLPLALSFYLGGTVPDVTAGLMVTLYFLALVQVARRHNASVLESLRLRYENSALVRELGERSSSLQVTIDSTSDGLGVFDRDARLARCNRQFLSLLGLRADAGASRLAWDAIVRDLGGAAGGARERRDDEPRLHQFQVAERTVEARVSPTVDGGFVVTCTDVTRRQQVEDALRGAKERAEEANLAKSRVLAAASHDIRQPLHALALYVDALGHKVEGDARAIVAQMEKAVTGMIGLFGSLLDLSRLDAGVVQPESVDFPVGRLLDQMATEFAPLAAEKGLDFRVAPSSAVVRSDPILLGCVVRNLLANAVRYTIRGRVLFGCRRAGTHLRLEVWDTGPGIPDGRVDDAFKEFCRLPTPGGDRVPGVGLGLAIVQRTARLLGHRIIVSSTPGRGSRFGVEVPLGLPGAATGGDAPTVELVGDLEGSLVGVIDDDGSVRDAMDALLATWGCCAVVAESAEELLADLASLRRVPDVVVADYRLGDGRDGLTAIGALREALGTSVAAVLVTGDTSPAELRAIEASGVPLLHKPVEAGKLRALLRFLVTLRRTFQAGG